MAITSAHPLSVDAGYASSPLNSMEHSMGYTAEFLSSSGRSADTIRFVKVRNSRMTNHGIEQFISAGWDALVQSAKDQGKNEPTNGDKARYEGFSIDSAETLLIHWSDEKYRTHAIIKETALPPSFQAGPLTINGIVITSDNKIPYGFRNPKNLDQGGIYHIVPAGYMDVMNFSKELNSLDNAVYRKLNDELFLGKPTLLENPVSAAHREFGEELKLKETHALYTPDASKMQVLGLIRNSKKNFDYTFPVLTPVSEHSSQIALKDDEHTQLLFLDTTETALREALKEFSLDQTRSSGHFRGDIALLIRNLYGPKAYAAAVESTMLALEQKIRVPVK